MPKFLIEREFPGAGKLGAKELQGLAAKSCAVLREMGPRIQWVESYVAEDKIYCVYFASNEGLIREHAQKGGFPVSRVTRISAVIDPSTEE